MIVFVFFLVPLIAGLLSFFIKNDKAVRTWSLLASLVTMALAIVSVTIAGPAQLSFSAGWMGSLGSSFSIDLNGMSQILCLLTAVAYPIIFLATWKTSYSKSNNFFALMLLTQAGLLGVFMATDALLFYFFWELALVPVYFLCSGWGGPRRIPVTFKFFVYTFTGSVLMLVGLLYIYFLTPDRSFSLESFYSLDLARTIDKGEQTLLFWILFVAFAIKMPVFPFHTWQPDTYEESPTSVTMVLSGLMVKMGVFGVITWVLPIVPLPAYENGNYIMSLGVIGIIYASFIALRQDDLKRLVAYSSIAHMGLMVTAIFAESESGMQGVMIQMFSHGVNIIGLWIIVEMIERQFKTRKLSELGGIAQKAPALAIFFVIVALANIALPLTNSFIGEFLMLNGIWNSTSAEYQVAFTALATLGIILSAAYTLRMIMKVLFGNTNALTAAAHDLRLNEKLALSAIVALILVFGIYPQPLLNLTAGFVEQILQEINVAPLFLK